MNQASQEIEAGKRAVNAVTPELIEKLSDAIAVILSAYELSEVELEPVCEAIKRKAMSNTRNSLE